MIKKKAVSVSLRDSGGKTVFLDSKSTARKGQRVRLSLRAPGNLEAAERIRGLFCRIGVIVTKVSTNHEIKE